MVTRSLRSQAAQHRLSGDAREGTPFIVMWALLAAGSLTGLLVDPLFQSVDAAAFAFAGSLALPVVAAMMAPRRAIIRRDPLPVILAAIYLLVMLASAALSAIRGASPVDITRSLAPLIAPLLVWGLVYNSASVDLLRASFWGFVFAGCCQAAYTYYLYLDNVAIATPDPNGALARVTYFDLRPLQPYILVSMACGAAYFFGSSSRWKTAGGGLLYLSAMMAVFFTQTRTLIITGVVLGAAAVALTVVAAGVHKGARRQSLIKLGAIVAFCVIAALLAATTHFGYALAQSIGDRFNGALDRDDWVMSMQTLNLGSIWDLLLGIGVGSSFDYYGAKVTFVHDVIVYHLVFAGLVGLAAYLAFNFYVAMKLFQGFYQERSAFFLAVFLSYCALATYSLTFAIYKWPTFNFVLGFFVVMAGSLSRKRSAARPSVREQARAADRRGGVTPFNAQ
jgi:hypothetical protein